MTPQSLINECRLAGVLVNLDGGALKLRGAPDAVRIAADRMRPFKAEIVQYQMGLMELPGQIREFMDDGLTLAEAQALAAVSVPVRQPAEWLALIAELDAMIGQYCAAAGLMEKASNAILATRNRQSLSSIPESLKWFRREVQILTKAPRRQLQENI